MAVEAKRLVGNGQKHAQARLLRDQKQHKHKRRHQRYDCFIISTITLLERSLDIDGIVKEMSAGGFLFRPASTFLLHREGDRIALKIGSEKFAAKIMDTKAIGYGAKFLDTMSEDIIRRLIAEHSIK